MRRVTSRRNAIVEQYRAVARGDRRGLLLDGAHLLHDALRADVRVLSAMVTARALEQPEIQTLLADLERRHVEVLSVSPAVMAAASPVRSPGAVVAIADAPALSTDAPYGGRVPFVVIACDVQDPGNLGAIVRVAEAGGASGVIAAGLSADPLGWKALRGSMGSALRLPIVRHPHIDQAIAHARARGCRVVATTPRSGRSLFQADLRGPIAILVGAEGGGLSRSVVDSADDRLTVPMEPPVESLNTAVTAALVVYEARRQRQ